MDLSIGRTPTGAQRERRAQRGTGPATRRGWQIGPKIRVGGSVGKIGQNVKIAAGKALSNPIVDGALTFIPGVGPGIAAAAGAAGRALDTSNGGLHGMSGVGSLAAGAAKGYAAGKVGQLVKSGVGSLVKNGAGAAATRVMGGGGTAGGDVASTGALGSGDQGYNDGYDPTAATGGDHGGFIDYAKKLISGGGSDGKGNMGELGDVMGRMFGGAGAGGKGSSLMDMLLMGGGIAESAADRQRSQGLQNRAVDYATKEYDANAPLRDSARSLIADRSTPDLSGIFANPGNTYDAQRRGSPQLGTRVPVASSY